MKKTIVKYFLLSLVLVVLFTECKKDDDDDNNNNNNTSIGPVPGSFTKKVLLEEFTATWCGYCTDGISRIHTLLNTNGSKLIVTAIHDNDAMSTTEGSAIESYFAPSGIPAGCVDRVPYNGSVAMNRGYWETVVNQELAKTPSCGLAIDASATGTVKVHVAFKQAVTGDVRLTVYLLEGGLKHNQSNNMNTQTGHEFYGAGNPIVDFEHEHVLRDILTADKFGEVLTVTTGQDIVKTYSYTLSGSASNSSIVAFVNVVGTSTTTHEILNAQEVKVGSVKDWN